MINKSLYIYNNNLVSDSGAVNLKSEGGTLSISIHGTYGRVSLADDGESTLVTKPYGWGQIMAGENEEFAIFRWKSNNIYLIYNTTNVATSDSDGNLCIYYVSPNLKIKNRLGGYKTVLYTIHHNY